jgi:hypothetical protein
MRSNSGELGVCRSPLLPRERGRVRVESGQMMAEGSNALTSVLSPSSRGEAGQVISEL